MRTPMVTLLLLLLAPLAAAQDERPAPEDSDNAWVEDCPPDMMCAYDASSPPRDENATYGDCGGEVCAYDAPGRFGPDDCIECSTPPKDDGATCMDGQQEGEACRDDVQYLDGRGPADCEYCRGEGAGPISSHADGDAAVQGDAKSAVPLPGVLAVFAGLAVAVLLLRRGA